MHLFILSLTWFQQALWGISYFHHAIWEIFCSFITFWRFTACEWWHYQEQTTYQRTFYVIKLSLWVPSSPPYISLLSTLRNIRYWLSFTLLFISYYEFYSEILTVISMSILLQRLYYWISFSMISGSCQDVVGFLVQFGHDLSVKRHEYRENILRKWNFSGFFWSSRSTIW